jgi:hypothetical protein
MGAQGFPLYPTKMPLAATRLQAIILHCQRHGVLAQLVERLNGIEEVRGSNPLGSTNPLVEFREAKDSNSAAADSHSLQHRTEDRCLDNQGGDQPLVWE